MQIRGGEMPIHNTEIASVFNQIADLLEIKGENIFRIRAYRNAAQVIKGLSDELAQMVEKEQDLTSLHGIGNDLAKKIIIICKTGHLPQLDELRDSMPGKFSELMNIEGLGGKRVKVLYEKLGVDSIDALKRAAEKNKIQRIEGFGRKTEQAILESVKRIHKEERVWRLADVEESVETLVAHLQKEKKVIEVLVAGSYRRKKETIHDIDILAVCAKDAKNIERFVSFDEVERIVSKGNTRSTVILRNGLQLDLRVVPKVSYGAALQYFTGSKEHNVAIRKLAVQRKLTINEYGIYRGNKRLAGESEEDIYKAVRLDFIPPELRENRGEIEAAKQGALPELVTLDDIKGDLHVHSAWSDGNASLKEMVQAAKNRRYHYLAFTDHSQRVTVANGLREKELRRQFHEIDMLQETEKKFHILKGAEVDILEDGSLDFPETILREMDLTVCSIHYKLNLSEKEQTRRVIAAIKNPYCTIIGHLTGRKIPGRGPIALNINEVLQAAADYGCVLEINGQPQRLDINDIICRSAVEKHIPVVLSTDAHTVDNLRFMTYAVNQARRGWVTSEMVANTKPFSTVKKLFAQKK